MKKTLFKYILALTTITSVSACGNNAVTLDPSQITDINQQVSDSSFFNNIKPDYPKVYPQFYNKKYPVAVMGHRGFRDVAPENTMVSFKKAYQIGADMLETDVHLTKDGEVVIIHDATLDRTTNGKGLVKEKTLAELKKLDAGSFFSPVFKGEQIPTLEEFIQFSKDKISMNIEIKKDAVDENQSQNGIEKKVVDLIVKYGMEEHVIICSFSELALNRVKRLNPQIPTGLLIVTDSIFKSQLSKVNNVKSDAVHEYGKFVSKSDIEKAHKYGIRENVWTIDDPHQMSELINKGVDGLITDRPDLALRVLEEKFPVRNNNL